VRGFVGAVGACSSSSAFVMVSCCGPAVSFTEFPDCLRSVGSGADMYYSVVSIREIYYILLLPPPLLLLSSSSSSSLFRVSK